MEKNAPVNSTQAQFACPAGQSGLAAPTCPARAVALLVQASTQKAGLPRRLVPPKPLPCWCKSQLRRRACRAIAPKAFGATAGQPDAFGQNAGQIYAIDLQ